MKDASNVLEMPEYHHKTMIWINDARRDEKEEGLPRRNEMPTVDKAAVPLTIPQTVSAEYYPMIIISQNKG
jgi:hypothetical protein